MCVQYRLRLVISRPTIRHVAEGKIHMKLLDWMSQDAHEDRGYTIGFFVPREVDNEGVVCAEEGVAEMDVGALWRLES